MKKVFLGILTIVSILGGYAKAGTAVSGGGGAIVCRNGNQDIVSAKLYDLYEGQVLFDLQPRQSTDSPQEQLTEAIDRVSDYPYLQSALKAVAGNVLGRVRYLPAGVIFKAPEDMGQEQGILVPRGCAIEGVGFYNSNGTLGISAEIFSQLSSTDKAALILHEVVYKLAREVRHTNSAVSRNLTAILFAENSTSTDLEKVNATFYQLNKPAFKTVPGASPYQGLNIRVKADDLYSPGRTSRVYVQCVKDLAVPEPEFRLLGEFKQEASFHLADESCLMLNFQVKVDLLTAVGKRWKASIALDVSYGSTLINSFGEQWQEATFFLPLAYPNRQIPQFPVMSSK